MKDFTDLLESDFSQSFIQLRHYDSQLWDICKFSFQMYATVLAISQGLIQLSKGHPINYRIVSSLILLVGLTCGSFIFASIIRTRAYFVRVARYVNAIRSHFLKSKPLGFENSTGMYSNPATPKYFDWKSGHSWLSYIVAFLNSVIFACLVSHYSDTSYSIFSWESLLVVVLTSAQIVSGYLFLAYKENH